MSRGIVKLTQTRLRDPQHTRFTSELEPIILRVVQSSLG